MELAIEATGLEPLRFVRRRGPCRSCRQAWRDLWLPGSEWRREVDDHSHALHATALNGGRATVAGYDVTGNRDRCGCESGRRCSRPRSTSSRPAPSCSVSRGATRALAIGYRYRLAELRGLIDIGDALEQRIKTYLGG